MPLIKVKDINIYHEIIGEGDPILFIHGLGSSTRDWEEQVPFFSKKFQVISVDIRGHGRSDKPKGPYSIPMFANDIAELLTELGVGPSHVIGISLGGGIAFQLSIDHPELVKSLVAVNAAVGVPPGLKWKFEFFKRNLVVKLIGMKKMGEILAPRLFIKPEQEENRQMLIVRWAENDKKAYLNALNSLKNWSVIENLSKIQCPTLVLGSDEDYTPTSAKEQYTALIPKGELVEIADARHALPMEKPKEFNEVVMNFISKHF
jgi:pimeloyl-ACP methyl ester carboxylesterase